MSQQPQGPGWWRAPDGRWYPPQPPNQPQYPPSYQQGPQFAAGPPPYTPPPPRRSNRGCMIAAIAVVVLLLVGLGIGAWALYRVGSAVSDVATGAGKTDCPTEAQVTTIVGAPVKLAANVSVVVAAGCSYLGVDRESGVDVQITIGAALIADDELKSFESDATTQGGSSTPIPVGSRGRAYGGEQRSAAIAVEGGRLVEVEVFSASDPIGDKQGAAVALLSLVLESN